MTSIHFPDFQIDLARAKSIRKIYRSCRKCADMRGAHYDLLLVIGSAIYIAMIETT